MGEGCSRQRKRQVPRSCGQVCLAHLGNCMGSSPPSWWGGPQTTHWWAPQSMEPTPATIASWGFSSI